MDRRVPPLARRILNERIPILRFSGHRPGAHKSLNSLGTTIGPKIGGLLILGAAPLAVEQLASLAPQALRAYRVQEAASVRLPYAVIGL